MQSVSQCVSCNKSFVPSKGSRAGKYCSVSCYHAFRHRPPVTCTCQQCGKAFPVKAVLFDRGQGKYCSSRCTGDAKRHPLIERFQQKVIKCPHEDACPYCCWRWSGAHDKDGYGTFSESHRNPTRAHRMSWELWHQREMSPEYFAVHYCHVNDCVNPSHVYPASPKFSARPGWTSPADPIRRAAYLAAYREKHREELREKHRAYAAANKEKIRIKNKRYAAQRKAYSLAHKAEKLAQVRAWAKANPERAAENARMTIERRRARKAQAPKNDLTAAQWRTIKAFYQQKCAYCGSKPKLLEMDHITPIAKGGSHTASNIVPACGPCNRHKASGPPPIPIQPLLFA